MRIGEGLLTGNDVPPGDYRKPQGSSLLYSLNDVSQWDRAVADLQSAAV
ncbi:MAG TPA: hypothetical protein VHC72_10865 [Bryobacteraceae bacterium]|nr:hypothetical protein [Bryobacteraceae bacterium]